MELLSERSESYTPLHPLVLNTLRSRYCHATSKGSRTGGGELHCTNDTARRQRSSGMVSPGKGSYRILHLHVLTYLCLEFHGNYSQWTSHPHAEDRQAARDHRHLR